MNEAYETCKRCNKVAGCFFLIISSVDRDMITKTVTFSIVGDFGFSMSPRDVYYQFHKNALGGAGGRRHQDGARECNSEAACDAGSVGKAKICQWYLVEQLYVLGCFFETKQILTFDAG